MKSVGINAKGFVETESKCEYQLPSTFSKLKYSGGRSSLEFPIKDLWFKRNNSFKTFFFCDFPIGLKPNLSRHKIDLCRSP